MTSEQIPGREETPGVAVVGAEIVTPAAGSFTASVEDLQLVEALRRGEESAFAKLLDIYHPSLVRLAMVYVSDRAVAEDVVQETWIGVLRGIHRFEGRSSLKTWIFRIMTNLAKTRAQREGRSRPFSALSGPDDDEDQEPTVHPARFLPADHPQWPGHWASLPENWGEIPEDRLLSQETYEQIRRAIAELPGNQQAVISLRDVQGWSSEEVCNVLGISETNQRVLLHRARSRVRRMLEQYFDDK